MNKKPSLSKSKYLNLIWSLIQKWTDILDLKDWDIRFVVDYKKCKANAAVALCEDDSSIKYALISFTTYKGFNCDNEYLEKTVIHELLHIKLSLLHPIDQDTLEYKVLHQAINDLSISFYRAREEGSKVGCITRDQ